MNIFEIIAVLIVLLIAIPIVLKKRKKCSSCHSSKETPKSESKILEQVKQQPETKSADQPVVNAKATVVNPPEPKPADKPVVNIESSAKPQAKVPFPENAGNSFLPQDSILKRHYLTHVYTMIDSLAPPRPTESVLRRHYDAIIITKVVQCLNDKKTMEQLIEDYKNRK
ncbi:hypothetical protein [Methylobacter sp.]|uniref:hypothetical protein n=1 Tax=Methylobacter sp. TaxID=2051955 RepID=UPI00120FF75B|nr:hypothetical protein [Methylobacter sp.]TAK61140.1 MAG: hypothetical protein EPO18_14950 [Methylobacter sp.]